MYPDAHLYIHRSEQAARDRAHLRNWDRSPRESHRLPNPLRSLLGRRHGASGTAAGPGSQRRRSTAAPVPGRGLLWRRG